MTLVLVEAVVVLVQNHVASRSVESSVREGNLQCVAVPAAAWVLVAVVDSVDAHEKAVGGESKGESHRLVGDTVVDAMEMYNGGGQKKSSMEM